MDYHDGIASRSFRTAQCGGEHYVSVEPPADLSFTDQIACLQYRYEDAQAELGLPDGSAVFRRLFVSDAMNQAALLRQSGFMSDRDGSPVALSIIQQPPLSRAKVALLAYHVQGGGEMTKRRLSPKDVLVERNGLRHVWTTGLCATADTMPNSAHAQTRDVFGSLIGTLEGMGGNLRDNCVRTWLYMKGVDLFYQDLVDSRRELFVEQGLTPDTHFIASTGIEGACSHRYDLVSMDAYSVIGLAPEQVSYLNDFDHLCPTADYNVTFERGTRVAYADRAHLVISGTASIDNRGDVVHPGDVLRQLDRALENVDVLLRDGGADLNALMHLIVYLRDPADYAKVEAALAARLPALPVCIVQGAVCRPEWLIEIEGIAIAPNDNAGLPRF